MNGQTSERKCADGKQPATKNGSSLPAISLLKGGGAIRGINEKFPVNSVIGKGSVLVSICTGRGHSGFGPWLWFSACALTIFAVGGGVVAALGLGSSVKHPQTVFFCSIILSSWFGGVWSGIFAALLSAMALDYYFIPPIYAVGISLGDAPDMVAFVASAFFVSWLSGKHRQAKDSRKDWEGTPEHGQTVDHLQVEAARCKTAEEGLMEAHAEVARLGRIRTSSAAAPIAPEPTERTAQGEELANGQTPTPENTRAVLLDGARKFLPHPPFLWPEEGSVFFRQGDYWTIQYEGQAACLKATRGLQCLAPLLEHPGREFYVGELVASVAEVPVAAVAGLTSVTSKEEGIEMRTTRFQEADPILDRRAKSEYARRLSELRAELDEAEQSNDPERARKARQERDCIADQLAVAVGLGGRDRKAMSNAERARSTVTKRIKRSIHTIAEAIPPLGRHLAARIKTGYFCSYSPNPDRSVSWKVRS